MNQYQDDYEIDLGMLFKKLWDKALVIILAALLTATAVYAGLRFTSSPAYETTVSMCVYLNRSKATSGSIGTTSFSADSEEYAESYYLVNTCAYISTSRSVLERVIAKADLPYTYEELADKVSSKYISNTSVFVVTVIAASPEEAVLIARAITEILPERIMEIVENSSVCIIDQAVVPTEQVGTGLKKKTVVGFLAGAVLAAGIITAQFLSREGNGEIIHSPDDLSRMYPNVKILTMIPDMNRSERKEYNYISHHSEKKKGDA